MENEESPEEDFDENFDFSGMELEEKVSGLRVVVTQGTIDQIKKKIQEGTPKYKAFKDAVIILRGLNVKEQPEIASGTLAFTIQKVGTFTLHRAGKEINFRVTAQDQDSIKDFETLFKVLKENPGKDVAIEKVCKPEETGG